MGFCWLVSKQLSSSAQVWADPSLQDWARQALTIQTPSPATLAQLRRRAQRQRLSPASVAATPKQLPRPLQHLAAARMWLMHSPRHTHKVWLFYKHLICRHAWKSILVFPQHLLLTMSALCPAFMIIHKCAFPDRICSMHVSGMPPNCVAWTVLATLLCAACMLIACGIMW